MLKQISFMSTRPLMLALLPLAGMLAACGHGVLDPAGDIARQERDLIYISTGLMLLIIVPVMILIVVFAWRYRKGGRGTYDPKFDHSASLELAIWSAPLLIIIALGALTWSSTHLLDPFRPLPAEAKAGTYTLVVLASDGDVVARAEIGIVAAAGEMTAEEHARMGQPEAGTEGPHPTAEHMDVPVSTTLAGWVAITGLIAASAGLGLALLLRSAPGRAT